MLGMAEQDEPKFETPPNRIGELRQMRRWTLAELARQVGTSAQQMGRLEAGQRRLTQAWMMKIAAALGVQPAALLPLQPSPAGTFLPVGSAALGQHVVPPPIAYIDVPVRNTKPFDQAFLISPSPIEYVLRPSPLVGALDGFAFRVVDRAMDPVYAQGDLLFADPRLEPRIGNDVVLIAAANHYAPVPALLGRLEAIAEETLRLRFLHTAEARSELRADWPNLAVIVGCFRGL